MSRFVAARSPKTPAQRSVFLVSTTPAKAPISVIAKAIAKAKAQSMKKVRRSRVPVRRSRTSSPMLRRPSSPRNDNRFLMRVHTETQPTPLHHALLDFSFGDINMFGSNLPTLSPIPCSS